MAFADEYAAATDVAAVDVSVCVCVCVVCVSEIRERAR